MDWDTEYEQSKNGGVGGSRGGRGAMFEEDDENPFVGGGMGAPRRGGGGGGGGGGGDDMDDDDRRRGVVDAFIEEEREETALEQLMRHWMNERHAPDILPAREDLLSNLLDHLRRQSEAVQLLREDPSTSDEEHIRIMLVQTEIERVKFIIRSYVRTRLFKVEKYARYIAINAEIQTRLTAAERDHAIRHARITDQHFYLSVLQSLPEAQSHLDDTPIFVPPMVTEPDLTRPVFVHALKKCNPVRLPDGATLEMNKGHISLVPYSVVEQLVAREEVELI